MSLLPRDWLVSSLSGNRRPEGSPPRFGSPWRPDWSEVRCESAFLTEGLRSDLRRAWWRSAGSLGEKHQKQFHGKISRSKFLTLYHLTSSATRNGDETTFQSSSKHREAYVQIRMKTNAHVATQPPARKPELWALLPVPSTNPGNPSQNFYLSVT